MNIQQKKMLVQSLTEAKAKILLAFVFAGLVAMDVKEIISWTGLKRQTIYDSLEALGTNGCGLFISRTERHGRKIWAPVADMLPTMSPQELEAGQMSSRETSENLIVVVDESKPELPSITTTTTTTGQMSPGRTSEELTALMKAFKTHKIVGSKRARLIACEWVSAEYVNAHVEHAKGELWDNPVGMAIIRMLDQEEAPATRKNGHPLTCQCTTCKVEDFMNPSERGRGGRGQRTTENIDMDDPANRQRYVTGKYSDYIEH